jgi:hypothetical protein
MKIAHNGRRETFPLGTPNRAAAVQHVVHDLLSQRKVARKALPLQGMAFVLPGAPLMLFPPLQVRARIAQILPFASPSTDNAISRRQFSAHP